MSVRTHRRALEPLLRHALCAFLRCTLPFCLSPGVALPLGDYFLNLSTFFLVGHLRPVQVFSFKREASNVFKRTRRNPTKYRLIERRLALEIRNFGRSHHGCVTLPTISLLTIDDARPLSVVSGISFLIGNSPLRAFASQRDR